MKTKLSLAASMACFAVGAVAQIWLPQLGLTLMLLGVMAGLAAVVLRQQAMLRRLSKHERLIAQVQKTAANGKVETATYGASILRRVKQLTDEALAQPSARPGRSTEARDLSGSPATEQGAGRAATPEVSNPSTDESLLAMLTPGRTLKVAGVFSPDTLPRGQHAVWTPAQVAASLEAQRPEALLIDEREIRESPLWSCATSGAGTALMRELLEGVRWAKARGIPAYLLPSSLAPDVHASALRDAPMLLLPLDDAALLSAAGGPQTPLLRALQAIALERQAGAL